MKFYRIFNAIYSKSKVSNSELVSIQLFKSYRLPFMVYATEEIPLSRGSLRMLDDCIKHAIVKIFKVRDDDTIDAVSYTHLTLPTIYSV